MSEEIKDAQNETPQGEGTSSGEKKRKKINRLTLEMVNKKIKDLEEKKHAGSRYYKHLLIRKSELESPGN